MEIMNIDELYNKIENKRITSEDDVISDHFKFINIISCQKCGNLLLPKTNIKFKYKFHCSRCDAKTTRNMLKINSCGASFTDILYFIYYMALDINLHAIRKLTKLTKKKLYRIQMETMRLMTDKSLNDFSIVGGPGEIVEIDESFIGKRKNNVGRVNRQKIIFGAICRETKDFRMIIIERRSMGRFSPKKAYKYYTLPNKKF